LQVMFKASALATVFGMALASAASAAVVFSDDFNYGPDLVLNAPDSTFAGTWVTTDGTVDYLAADPAQYNELCRGSAGCIDLDGSTNNSGLFSTVASFAAGTYELTIQLFGNGRGGSDTVTITLGSWSVTSLTSRTMPMSPRHSWLPLRAGYCRSRTLAEITSARSCRASALPLSRCLRVACC